MTARVHLSSRNKAASIAPEKFKVLMMEALARDSDLIGVGYSFGIGIFNFSHPTPSGPDVQPGLGTPGLG